MKQSNSTGFNIFTWVLIALNVWLVLGFIGALTMQPELDCSRPEWQDRPGWCEDIVSTRKTNAIGSTFASLFFFNLLLLPIWFMLKKKVAGSGGDE
jgi:hypothetical protein